jgi:hypothetical protein
VANFHSLKRAEGRSTTYRRSTKINDNSENGMSQRENEDGEAVRMGRLLLSLLLAFSADDSGT